jgi:competence protein ComEA
LFGFNPNTISIDSLLLLGLKPKTAEIFIKFRKATGGFKNKEELKQVYGVSDKLYEEIAPFIKISENQVPEFPKKVMSINLNTATKEELMKAKGIGSSFSKRIIEYRIQLGGFASVDQLAEVYGIDKEWVKSNAYQFEVDSKQISKIKINSIEFKALLKHPYFSYSEVKRIINYREMHGKFSTFEQIRDNNLINAEQYRKIADYLSLE